SVLFPSRLFVTIVVWKRDLPPPLGINKTDPTGRVPGAILLCPPRHQKPNPLYYRLASLATNFPASVIRAVNSRLVNVTRSSATAFGLTARLGSLQEQVSAWPCRYPQAWQERASGDM